MAFNLSAWLRKTPQPVTILADTQRIEVPKHARSWSELTKTIMALAPGKVSALDGQGAILRTTVLEDEDDKSPSSPELSDVQCFARLIAEAYEKGTKSYAPLLESAMSFIERQGQRLASMEREIEKLRTTNARMQAEILAISATPDPEGGENGIIAAFAHAALAAQGQPGANGVAAPPNTKRRDRSEGA